MPLSETTEDEKEKNISEVYLDPNLKIVWVDSFNIAKREDDLCYVRLCANLPEGLYEQSKFMTDTDSLKELAKSICSILNYYPTKPQTKSTKTGKKLKL